MDLTWLGCAATTGEVIAELPGLVVTGALQQVIGAYSTLSATLPIADGVSPDWVAATEPNGSYLVLLADGEPVDGYLVTKRDSTDGDTVALGLASVTAYFDRRFVGDEDYSATDQCSIVEDLVTTYVADSLPITVEASASAFTRDRTYFDNEDKTVYSVLTELSDVLDGPEFAVRWQVSTVGVRVAYVPVLVVADRLGVEPFPGLAPAVTFDLPGSVSAVQWAEDYSVGQGANVVRATSTADGDTRPESPDQVDVGPNQLRCEYRFTPSTSITDTATLTTHAQAALSRLVGGSNEWVITLDADSAPRFGVDWWLGDTVALSIAPGNTSRWPDGLTQLFRVVGCKWTTSNTPTLEPIVSPL
jgi:hypothetical protein